MRRLWSLLFAIGSLACAAMIVAAPFLPEWWLPMRVDVDGTGYVDVGRSVSALGREIDLLFNICMWITGLTFVGVAFAFCWFAWKYGEDPKSDRKAVYSHGSKRLEIIWTLVPALILVFLAVFQLGTWAQIKMRPNAPQVPPIAEVTAKQFQWVTRYAGPDSKLHSVDDVITVNDFHFYAERSTDASGKTTTKGVPTVINLRSSDVLHSFFLPTLRIKQDAVPGLTIPVWFDADVPGAYELVCTELCGWGHYKMRSKVTVHASKAEFDQWLAEAAKAQSFDGVSPSPTTAPTPAPAVANKG